MADPKVAKAAGIVANQASNVVANNDPQAVANKYQLSWAIINSDPQLKKWFNDFAKRFVKANGQISEAAFQLELNAQPFWQKHSASWIADRKQELEHNVDWEESLKGDISSMRDVANTVGAQIDDASLRELAIQARRGGWNESQKQHALASFITPGEGNDFENNAGKYQDDLVLWASKNGLSVTNDMVGAYVKGIMSGAVTIDEVKSDLRKTYMSGAYPAWADKINAGMDIADLAAPYIQSVGGLLESPDVGLDDPLMKKIMQGVGADGKPRQVPLYEAEQMVRQDPRWQKTDNAYKTYAGVAHDILKTFGFE